MSNNRIEKISDIFSLDKLIGLQEIKLNLKKIIKDRDSKKIPHFYFYGSPGTGKTSTTLAFLRELCRDNDGNIKNVYLFNLSYKNSVDYIRSNIVSLCKYKNHDNQLDMKFIILDEFDSVSQDAQSYISYCMRKYPKVCFFFISNRLDSIIPTIIENSVIVHFDCYKKQDYKKLIKNISPPGIEYNNTEIEKYCYIGNYDMRKIKNIITIDSKIIDLFFDKDLLDKDDETIIKIIHEYLDKGYNYHTIFSFYKNQINNWIKKRIISDIEFNMNSNIHIKNVLPSLIISILELKKLKNE
jgi:DNA polymerase III delta prime subunit